MPVQIAALFVEEHGTYSDRDGVDLWHVGRDARLYRGPYAVVAHPPCERWGRYWFGGPSAKVRRVLGDDGGCFSSALASVRKHGGVLEHPAASHAWAHHGIARPPNTGGWVVADDVGGYTCHVEQGHYGHKARKATWLYAFGTSLPHLRWGPSEATARLDEGFHTAAERKAARDSGVAPRKRLSPWENLSTPPDFARVLIRMARSSRR